MDLESNSQKLFQEHEAPVLSLALHPEETYLVLNHEQLRNYLNFHRDFLLAMCRITCTEINLNSQMQRIHILYEYIVMFYFRHPPVVTEPLKFGKQKLKMLSKP